MSVVLDLKATPGEWKAGAEALAQAAGFEPCPGEPVRFLGAARAKAVVSGTVLPDRMAELLTVAAVLSCLALWGPFLQGRSRRRRA